MTVRTATPHDLHREQQHREACYRVLGRNTVDVLREYDIRVMGNDVPEAVICHRCKYQRPRSRPTVKAWINWYRRCPFCLGKGRVAVPMSELRYQKIL